MPEQIITTPAKFPKLLKERLQRDLGLLRRATLEAAMRGVGEAVRATDDRGLVHLGYYKLSWKANSIPQGAELRNDAPYAGVIEWGRRPGRPGPPLEPIREWVARNLVANGVVKPQDAERVAFAIRRAIHVRGTPPRFVLRGLLPRLRDFLLSATRRQLGAR